MNKFSTKTVDIPINGSAIIIDNGYSKDGVLENNSHISISFFHNFDEKYSVEERYFDYCLVRGVGYAIAENATQFVSDFIERVSGPKTIH